MCDDCDEEPKTDEEGGFCEFEHEYRPVEPPLVFRPRCGMWLCTSCMENNKQMTVDHRILCWRHIRLLAGHEVDSDHSE